MADEVLAVMKRSEELNVRALRPGCPRWDLASSRPLFPTRFLILVFKFSHNPKLTNVGKQAASHPEWATTLDIDTYQLMHMMDKVLNRSILTLLYRAIPSPPGSGSTFTAECVEAARAALEKHEDCMERLKPYDAHFKTLYLHW